MSRKVDLGRIYDGRVNVLHSSSRLGSWKFKESHRVVNPVRHGRDQLSNCKQHVNDDDTGYKGIRYRPELGRYISEIRPALPSKRKIWLGTCKTAAEAARAFNVGIFYTGKKIPYNFPDTAKLLQPLDENLTQDQRHVAIQKRAKVAAAAPQQQQQQHPNSCADDHHTLSKQEPELRAVPFFCASADSSHHMRSSCSSS